MTENTFKRLLMKIPTGEYYANSEEIYEFVCSKSYQNMNFTRNRQRRDDFCRMFYEKRYGFEYLTHGKIFYVGTNDLDTIYVH